MNVIAFAETCSPMRSPLNDAFKHLQISMHDIFPTISDLIGQLEHVASPLSEGCLRRLRGEGVDIGHANKNTDI